ncbi:MAG: phage holin family protein [Bacteroidota bacterium]
MSSDPPRGRPSASHGVSPAPGGHQLPARRGKLERVQDHVAAISADLREYVELRIALTKAEINETIDEKTAQAKEKAKPFGFFAAAGFFALYWLGFTFALIAAGFAWIFGADPVFGPAFFGILVSWGVLLLCVAIPALIGRRLLKKQEVEAKAKKVQKSAEADDTLRSVSRQIQE